MRWVILKGGLFVGPGTGQTALLEKIRTGVLRVPGNGSHFVSLVHVQDVAEAYLAALERAPAASIFNICADPIRYGEYVDRLADLLHVAHPLRDTTQAAPPSHRASNRADREQLGWEPKCSIWPEL